VFGVGVTLVGLVAVAVLTGAFASGFGERLREFRRGTIAIFERDHILVVGWSGRGEVVVRELAQSGIDATVVILTAQPRETVEERLRDALSNRPHRLRLIVSHGDPTTTAALERAAARHARVALILPEPPADPVRASGERADRDALRSLLALRRVVRERQIGMVVEVSGPHGRELVQLAPGTDNVVVVEAQDVNASLLVHSVRQPGAYAVVREILALDARSIYLHPAGTMSGRTFDEAHAAIERGVLVGLLRGRMPMLCPQGTERLREGDQLLVFADDDRAPGTHGKLPAPTDALVVDDAAPPATTADAARHRDSSVLVVGYKPELSAVLGFLSAHGAERITILAPERDGAATEAAVAAAGIGNTVADLIVGDPFDTATLARATLHKPDVVLLLAPDVPAGSVADADADQLITLLQLRRMSDESRRLRAVVEVQSPETERLAQRGDDSDFVLSREVVGLLLAQELHALWRDRTRGAWLGAVYYRILERVIADIHVHPMSLYAGKQARPSFGCLAAHARTRDEVAIGVVADGLRAELLPGRGDRFDAVEGAAVVVVGPHR
jgi:ion channel POLLUX/CASTOR